MANLAYRRNSIARSLSSYLAPGASYTITVYPAGAQVSGNQSGTSITVRAGHYIPYGGTDVVVIRPGSPAAIVSGTFQAASSATATTVVFPSSVTVLDGDLIVPLGSDTGATTPAWDGSAAAIYTDMAGGSAITSSRVTSNTGGEYEYWSLRRAVWEIIRDSGGTVQDIVPSVFPNERQDGIFNVLDFGAKGDGSTNDTTAFQAAIDVAYNSGSTPNSGGTVFVPAGQYRVGTITLKERVSLKGAGTGDANGGTYLKAIDSLNANVIDISPGGAGYWHYAEISNLSVDGNKANNTSGHCIDAGKMGEASNIRNVYVVNAAQDGIYITDESTPSSLYSVSAFNCGRYGFNLDAIDRHVSLINCSGDHNVSGLLRVNGNASGALASVVVVGIKAERSGDAGTVQDPCVLIDDFVGPVTFVGGTIDGNGTNTGTSAVKRTGASTPRVAFIGTRIGGYTNQYEDAVTSAFTVSKGTGTTTFTYFMDQIDGSLRLDDDFYARRSEATQVFIGALNSKAAINFGSAGDTNLYRDSDGVLKTDDALLVTGNITTSAALLGSNTDVNITGNDNVTTAGRFLINLTNVSGTNTITLSAPSSVNGQTLILRCAALTAGTVSLADSGNVALSAAWTPDAGDTLTLVANGVVWYELARSSN